MHNRPQTAKAMKVIKTKPTIIKSDFSGKKKVIKSVEQPKSDFDVIFSNSCGIFSALDISSSQNGKKEIVISAGE